ncbi:MAG TPA: cytochrome c, partial [Gaiellaceae bacterium]|nr:cytochrome c [Gaiellaceae bacterium]
VFAAVLVGFALIVSLYVPRRWPDFPGRHMKIFVLLAVLLVAGMLASVEALGEGHEFSAHGGAAEATPGEGAPPTEGSTSEPSTTGETAETGTAGTEPSAPAGDPAAGKPIFASAGCGTCHSLQDAGTNATVGPNLDEALSGQDADFIQESIVDPDAEIADGFQPGLMPQTYDDQFDDKQLSDLVAYLADATAG